MTKSVPSLRSQSDQIHFDSLLEKARQAIALYSDKHWTDTAEHDPGITLIEGLAYAISDLAYRHTLPLTDLLTPAPAEQSEEGLFPAAFGPHQALTSSPITEDDYRRAILDLHRSDEVVGAPPQAAFYFRNVQLVLEPRANQYTYWYDKNDRVFKFSPKVGSKSEQLWLTGNYHLYVELNRSVDRTQAEKALKRFLFEHRNLCEGVREIFWVEAQQVDIKMIIEVEEDFNQPAALLAQIFTVAEDILRPQAARFTAVELSEQGLDSEAIYHGPLLKHGWIPRLPPARDYRETVMINISELAGRVQGLAGVQRVRHLGLDRHEDWEGSIESGRYALPWGEAPFEVLASGESVALIKDGQPLTTSALEIAREVSKPVLINEGPVTLPYGRWRNAARYRSVSDKIPPCYGLQQPEPDLQQRRLHQFLLPFEQQIASGCDQLARLPRLLAFDRSRDPRDVNVWGGQWPFEAGSQGDRVHAAYFDRLDAEISTYRKDEEKELALIGYLLGYFGDRRAQQFLSSTTGDFVNVQRGFLRWHSELTYARGTARIDRVLTLQRRIAARLGVGPELFEEASAEDPIDLGKLPFYLIEHRALLATQPDPKYDQPQVPARVEVDDEDTPTRLTMTVLGSANEVTLKVGQLIDLLISRQDGGAPYVVAAIMVAEVSGNQIVFVLADHGQLARDWDEVVEAGANRKLFWRNSAAWLNDMSFPLQYDDGLLPTPPGFKRIISNPYPGRLAKKDHVLIYHGTSSAVPPVKAEVTSVDRIRGSLVVYAVEGGQLPSTATNYRWRVDEDVSDRFSFVVSVVFNRELLRGETEVYVTEAWIRSVIQEELPCHVSCFVHWLNEEDFGTFAATYKRWQNGGMPLGMVFKTRAGADVQVGACRAQ